MRIINIVEVDDNVVLNIDSFPVFEEQLSNDVAEEVEELFKDIVSKKIDANDDEMDAYFKNGVYRSNGYSCSIVLSYLDIGDE